MTSYTGYVQLKRSQETFDLVFNNPLAYLVLSAIAIRAVRQDDSRRGLKAGQAMIGVTDLEPAVDTDQLKALLEDLQASGHIRYRSTRDGLLVDLVSTSILDINKRESAAPAKTEAVDSTAAAETPRTSSGSRRPEPVPPSPLETDDRPRGPSPLAGLIKQLERPNAAAELQRGGAK